MSRQLDRLKEIIVWRYVILPLCFVMASALTGIAQYSLIHTPSGLEEWTYSDLMNCTIINGSGKSPVVYINCTVTSNQRVVLRAQSNVFKLNTGTNLISRGDVDNKLMPIKTIFMDAKVRAMMEKTATPIDGQYDVKLDLVEQTENAVLTYSQYYKTVKSLSPFRLITPFDGSTLTDLNPTFTWTRPLSMGGSFDGQTYNIKVVEIYNGQSAYQAIRSNVPVLRQDGLTYNLLQTPYNNEHLQSCKKYAWQVEVVNGKEGQKQPSNISEVWSFSTSCTTITSKYVQTPYYGAKTKAELYSYPAYDTLRISVESLNSSAENIKVKIVDVKNRTKELTMQNEQDAKGRTLIYVGENRFAIPLIGKGLKQKGQYLLTITDGSAQYYVPFQYLGEEK
jgi:hypothetical protein